MQPYFLPYLGYFSLIDACDEFIVFDTPQYIRHGWIERNRILKLNGEPNYIKVALNKSKQKDSIKSITINNNVNWKKKIFAQLTHYKKKAPNYNKVIELLQQILKNPYTSITELNVEALREICVFLNIKTPIKIWSEMNMEIEQVNTPDEWALNICKAYNANSYINAIGGKGFFDVTKYLNANVDIKFLDFEPTTYKQFENEFVPFLSIIDVLMFNDIYKTKTMINSFSF